MNNETKKAHILAVDDSPTALKSIENIIEDRYIVTTCSSGEEALESYKIVNPDLILLDIILPGISGIEACKKIISKNPNALVIIITSKTDESDVVEGLEAGAIDYIKKPFSPIELLARIKSGLRLHDTIESFYLSNIELKKAVDSIDKLQGLLPICTNCKKIRDDDGYWFQVEKYIETHSDASFSHSICPVCADKLYPDIMNKIKKKENID